MTYILEKLDQIPLELTLEKTETPNITRFSFLSLHQNKVYGHMYESHVSSKKTWIILYHGLGAHTLTPGYLAFVKWWTDQGYDVIGMDVRHQGGLTKGIPSIDQRGLYVSGVAQFETYYYTTIYADAYRLVTVAKTLKPDHHVYATGGSQGGALAFFAATMHQEVELLMIEMPSNVCIPILVNTSEGGFKAFKTHHVDLPDWLLSDIDLLAYAKKLHIPILMASGTNDTICPYSTAIKLYDMLDTKKKIITYEGFGHGGYDDLFFQEKLQFIFEHQKKG